MRTQYSMCLTEVWYPTQGDQSIRWKLSIKLFKVDYKVGVIAWSNIIENQISWISALFFLKNVTILDYNDYELYVHTLFYLVIDFILIILSKIKFSQWYKKKMFFLCFNPDFYKDSRVLPILLATSFRDVPRLPR